MSTFGLCHSSIFSRTSGSPEGLGITISICYILFILRRRGKTSRTEPVVSFVAEEPLTGWWDLTQFFRKFAELALRRCFFNYWHRWKCKWFYERAMEAILSIPSSSTLSHNSLISGVISCSILEEPHTTNKCRIIPILVSSLTSISRSKLISLGGSRVII